MINVPLCCSNNPYGFFEFKIENFSTKIPLCKKHHMLHRDNGEGVSAGGYILENDEKIDGVTNLKFETNLNFVEKILDEVTRIDNAYDKMNSWQEEINMFSRDLYEIIKENKDKIKKC